MTYRHLRIARRMTLRTVHANRLPDTELSPDEHIEVLARVLREHVVVPAEVTTAALAAFKYIDTSPHCDDPPTD